MASASDIRYFFESNTRDNNDKANRIRENCLLILNTPTHEFFEDKDFGEKWCHLRREFESILLKLTAEPCVSYNLKKEANRKNHDFDLLLNREKNTEIVTLEFKCSQKNDMPQFFTAYDYDRYFPETFAEFWYDRGGLDKMLELYPTKLTKPSRDEYLSQVYKYIGEKTEHPFFKQLYEWDIGQFGPKTDIYKRKNTHVQQCIEDYLLHHLKSFDIAKFKEKLEASQKNKVYAMWNRRTKKFEVFKYSKLMLSPVKIDCIRLKHDIIIDTEDPNYQIKCLLRWKNHNGIGLPGYQISMVKKKDR